ncbi:MAG: acylneuraminate cytidylyltransferase family protein [Rubrivivax sp.]|nr:acylneuraminate cytidylyltransferase family protein [Rubrivivax sp.]
MIEGRRVLALVPARRGSKGLPLKNIRPLHGKPLLAWPIAAARASRHVDRVVLSTDDAGFAELGRQAGADVPFLRPAELASDDAPSIGFILHALDALDAAGDRFDYLVLLEPTSPLTEGSDIDAALAALHAASPRAQALVGVSPIVNAHPAFAVRLSADGLLRPYAAGAFDQLPRRQDIEPLYALDGSLYISTVASLRARRAFCHGGTLPHVMPRYKSFEIDDLVDFICVEALLAHRALLDEAPSQ